MTRERVAGRRAPTPADPFDGLLAAARAGHEPARAALYHRAAGEVLGFLRARGTPEPEEVVNDVFVAVLTSLDRFVGDESSFRAWTFQIARHKRVDALRRHGRAPDQTSVAEVSDGYVGGHVESEAIARLEDHALRALLEPLTPDQRDVLLLRLVADLSLAQVAIALDKPVGAVKSLQHRAIAQVRTQLAARSSQLD